MQQYDRITTGAENNYVEIGARSDVDLHDRCDELYGAIVDSTAPTACDVRSLSGGWRRRAMRGSYRFTPVVHWLGGGRAGGLACCVRNCSRLLL